MVNMGGETVRTCTRGLERTSGERRTDAGVKAEVVERATRQIEINRCIMVTGEGVVVAEPRR